MIWEAIKQVLGKLFKQADATDRGFKNVVEVLPAGKFKISKTGLKLIRDFEGIALKPYICPAGIRTIGIGHAADKKNNNGNLAKLIGIPDYEVESITEQQALDLLSMDIREFEDGVNNLNLNINQNQFDALVSFVFNLGLRRLIESTLLKKLKANDTVGAANEFDKWKYAGGRVLPGLVRRRAAEKALFLK